MIKLSQFFILLIVATLIFTACKKKDKVDNCSLTEANFAGSYKIESVMYKMSPTSPEIDGTFLLNSCELDDITTFNSNHTYTYIDAGTQCAPPGDDSGSWSLNGNILNFDGRFPTIDVFDCTGVTITDTSYNIDGDKIALKLKRQ